MLMDVAPCGRARETCEDARAQERGKTHLLLRGGISRNDQVTGPCTSQHLCYFTVPLPDGVTKRRTCVTNKRGISNEQQMATSARGDTNRQIYR